MSGLKGMREEQAGVASPQSDLGMGEPQTVFIALGDCVVEVRLISENEDGVLVQLIGWRIAGQSQIRWPTYHTDWDSAADEAARNFHAYVAACRAKAVTDRHDAND